MGKHNGKARKSGLKVGSMLTSKSNMTKKEEWAAFRHTTEAQDGGPNMQSIIEQNDLSELMHMANLAGRDFAGERGEAVVVSTGLTSGGAALTEEERHAAEQRNAHKLRLPRRPEWNHSMSADQVQAREASMFLNWRREIAKLEEAEKLTLTPFEKNLEVWRQLWRVVERSDVLVQVIDARDPLFYRSEDLEAYAKGLSSCKSCLLLLNKADLLPEALRVQWADYFDARGIRYTFWSAFACIERQKLEKTAAAQRMGFKADRAPEPADARVRILDEPALIEFLDAAACAAHAAAVAAAGAGAVPEAGHVPTVGLIGYPNVGKSSTINALFGSKKTAVAPTPGKTKHFQTLFISPDLMLCDCPGLVLPRFADSRSDMVAAGVVPIDRLTEMRGPVGAVAQRISRQQMSAVLHIAAARPRDHEDSRRPPTAAEVLRAYAASRGWLNGSGLPDETRTGRQILKDYTSGRLTYCTWPPGAARPCPYDDGLGTFTSRPELLQYSSDAGVAKVMAAASGAGPAARGGGPAVSAKDQADMRAMSLEAPGVGGAQRAEHKFQKKPQKHKAQAPRVSAKAGVSPYGGFDVDGAQLETFVQVGKKGGVIR